MRIRNAVQTSTERRSRLSNLASSRIESPARAYSQESPQLRTEWMEAIPGNRAKTRYAVLLALVFIAICTRLAPLAISPYPFNNDGITECRIASDIISSRSLSYPPDAYYADSHSVLTPAYDVLLAFVSVTVGTSPFWVAQLTISIFSVLTIVGVYSVVLKFSSDMTAALSSSLVLCLFGSFVFLTGSAWKESLGVAMLVLTIVVYIRRSDVGMHALCVVILLVLPIVHHLVVAVTYLALWYLTILSLVFAYRQRSFRTRHLRDSAALLVATAFSYLYYLVNDLGRLDYINEFFEIMTAIGIFTVMFVIAYWFLNKKSRFRCSFAPVPAAIVMCVFLIDYVNPIFGYEQATPVFVIVLAFSMSVIVGIGWYGIEHLAEIRSAYRSIPLGFLFPALIILSLAVFTESGQISHWMTYRTYDFVDISLAIGVGAAFASTISKPHLRKAIAVTVLVVLVLSFPFGYATNALTGVRHDTQPYEVDAMAWMHEVYGDRATLQSDERLSYNAQALYDIPKDPYLPRMLSSLDAPAIGTVNLFLYEWCTIGVSDYPEGRAFVDDEFISDILSQSDVLYVGGPFDNRITVFAS